MAVRLNRALNEFNVGIQTVAEFLLAKGVPLQSKDINTKLTDVQYNLLADKFVKGTRLNVIRWNDDSFTLNSDENRKIVNSHSWNRMHSDTIIILPTRYVIIPKNQDVDKFPYWTREDFDSKCQNSFVGGKIIKERLAAPSGYLPITPYIESERDAVQNGIQDTHRINIQQNKFKPSVLGSIDLSALNASSRLKKRSNDNLRNEREERKYWRQSKDKQRAKEINRNHNSIRDIWQNFVDIQEKLIRQRCAPISIIPDSIEVENDKLYVTVDESQNEQQLDSILKGMLGLDSYNLESGYILVDESKWNALSESDLEYIRNGLSECYVELDTTPTINVSINYGGDRSRFDQLSIDELRQLETILKNGDLIEGSINDKAAFISKVYVDRDGLMKYLFGSHYVTHEEYKKNEHEPIIVEAIEYRNQYIPWDVMQKYANLGLNCKQYTIKFRINDCKAKEKLKDCYDCYSNNSDAFEFCRKFTKKDSCHKDYAKEAYDNIQVFMSEASLYCSEDDIDIEIQFFYTISKHQLVKSKFEEVSQYIKNKGGGYSFSEETGAIGIDFNWRSDKIEDILSEIESAVPFIKINVHDEHRFKCSVKSQLVGYDTLKESLENKYEDIDIKNDNIHHQIKIRLPYLETKYYEAKCASLERDLLSLTVPGIDIQFAEKAEGKIRLNVYYNKESRIEDLEDSIVEMRKADFGFLRGETEVPFGKLLKANYPDLIFDIDVPEEEKDEIIDAFESKAISTIVPILTGDLEKISRLKDTFTKATTGSELVNPRLQRFIFDSSEATKTSDIDLILRKDGVVYKELCEHLLNPRINESQKEAIIKALYAEDLAVIQGPPGTGKSTAIAEMIWQLIHNGLKQGNKPERILLTSETNLAVDNAISRVVNDKTNLVKPVRFGGEEKLEPEGLMFSIELMKRWVEEGDSCLIETETDEDSRVNSQNDLILKHWLNNISSRSFFKKESDGNDVIGRWRNFLHNPSKALRKIVYKRYVENANVIGATCSSIGDKRAGNEEFNGFTSFYHNYCEVFKEKKGIAKIEFTTVIQDESSKATPAELVLPFVYGQKAIVIGDHRQLPPILDKEEFETALEYTYKIATNGKDRNKIHRLSTFINEHFEEMEVSHFQRLYENIDISLKGTFNLQYRMHPDINEVIEQFYREDGGLACGLVKPKDLGVNDHNINNPASRYHGLDIPGLIGHNTHVLFIDSNSPEMMDGTSRVNFGEVDTIDTLLTRFENSGSFQRYLRKFTKEEDKQIGIISFYGKQIKQLKSISHKHSTLPIRVSTVDRFQGMERNIIIVSMVRSNTIQSSKNQQPDWNRYPNLGYPKQTSLGFAQSPNRLNVALSRAKRLLIIVGNRKLFSTHEIYQRLFLTIEANKNNRVIKQQEV